MDSLDVRLFREMCLGGLFSLRGIDPRLSAQVLARNVGASRITVSRRLRFWRKGGFWRGLVAYPNPDLLGTSFQMQGFVLGASRHRGGLESALDRVLEPVFSFQTEDFYNPVLLKESPARADRRQRALGS